MQTTSFSTKDGLSFFITPTNHGTFFSVYSRATHTTLNLNNADARVLAERIINALDNHALESNKKEEETSA